MSVPSLSIIITIVSGTTALRRCLGALRAQLDAETEIIVPYEQWSEDAGTLANVFPEVRFHHITELGAAANPAQPAHAHRLYDRRRAVGLAVARGALIAMTEDHAVPAPNWCQQIRAAHTQPYAVIGGAIDNAVDSPLNWALYYCDFGRYGRPLVAGPAAYVSDVNVSYKRHAIDTVRDLWREVYHETTVHWALQSRGETLFLDPRLVVYQHRPAVTFSQAYRERIEWGRVFAETRTAVRGSGRALSYAAVVPALPLVLLTRALRHMRRQRRTPAQIVSALPLTFALLTGWALGELSGYLTDPRSAPAARVVDS